MGKGSVSQGQGEGKRATIANRTAWDNLADCPQFLPSAYGFVCSSSLCAFVLRLTDFFTASAPWIDGTPLLPFPLGEHDGKRQIRLVEHQPFEVRLRLQNEAVN
jgi:hypothetical protein